MHKNTYLMDFTACRYVSDTMGGVVKKMGAFGYELLAGKTQQERQSNLLPLGEVTAGVFQHRALLFKVRIKMGSSCDSHMTGHLTLEVLFKRALHNIMT